MLVCQCRSTLRLKELVLMPIVTNSQAMTTSKAALEHIPPAVQAFHATNRRNSHGPVQLYAGVRHPFSALVTDTAVTAQIPMHPSANITESFPITCEGVAIKMSPCADHETGSERMGYHWGVSFLLSKAA